MKEKIQIINLKENGPIEGIKFNLFRSPESFDDYDINVIDLSQQSVWYNRGYNLDKLNIDNDLASIIEMIKVSSSKILILLPQNISLKFNFGKPLYSQQSEYYQNSIELKNCISLLNSIINKLLGSSIKDSLILYNKTKTKIQDQLIESDFVFSEDFLGEIITTSNNQKSITTIGQQETYFTTLDLSKNNYVALFPYLQEIHWLGNDEEFPEWIDEIDFLDDLELKNNQNELIQKKNEISKEIDEINEKICHNLYYKSILYTSGDQLVAVVNQMLDEMLGYNYKEFVDLKEEDFRIEKEDVVFIGEIKGITSNVKRSNISQTATHRDFYLEINGNENKKAYAIAIINNQRFKPLKEREPVHQDIVKLAKMNDVLIITSDIFLKVYEKFRNKQLNSDDIKTMFCNKGLLEI